MITKYEKEENDKDKDGKDIVDESGSIKKSFNELPEKDKLAATHIHYCGHDEGKPCRRVKL